MSSAQSDPRAIRETFIDSLRSTSAALVSLCKMLPAYNLKISDDSKIQHNFDYLQRFIKDQPSIFQRLHEALKWGKAHYEFPVGTEIPDIWTDRATGAFYHAPLIIVDYRNVQTRQNENDVGAVLLRKFTSPCKLPFTKAGMPDCYDDSYVDRYLNPSEKIHHRLESDYLDGCSEGLNEFLTPVAIETTEYPNDDGQPQTHTHFAHFFLPSTTELSLFGRAPEAEEIEQIWEYFICGPHSLEVCMKRIFCDPTGHPQDCWLRDGTPRGSTLRNYVMTDGGFYCADVHKDELYIAPACVIT